MVTSEFMVQRWTDPKSRPLFKGKLIDETGCKCAQGDVLACAGWTDDQLREVTQDHADKEVARILGIPRAQAILLRNVNDSKDGCPQDVLSNPEKILGNQAGKVLAFWARLDGMTPAQWDAAGAAARDAAWAAAGAAARASNEIQGADIMRERGQPFFFLPMFGISNPDELEAYQ